MMNLRRAELWLDVARIQTRDVSAAELFSSRARARAQFSRANHLRRLA